MNGAPGAHLSRAQFARRFHAVAGQSPLRFIIHARLERARQLMQDHDHDGGTYR